MEKFSWGNLGGRIASVSREESSSTFSCEVGIYLTKLQYGTWCKYESKCQVRNGSGSSFAPMLEKAFAYAFIVSI